VTEEEELQHFGIPGMKWGRRKEKFAATSLQGQARHIARREAGIIAVHEGIRRYGKYAIPAAGKVAYKGGKGLVKYGPRVAKGGLVTAKLLGMGAKYGLKGGKAYVKGAIGIAKALR
jgi:hypothetical protein